MAKALLGHLGGTDLRVVAEVGRLRARIGDLESQLMRLQAENDALAAELHRDDLITLDLDGQSVLAGSGA